MDNKLNHTRIIIDNFEKQTLVNFEVGNRLYPIATLHKSKERLGEVTIDDRTNNNVIYTIGSFLQVFGERIKIALNQSNLMQNKPQQD